MNPANPYSNAKVMDLAALYALNVLEGDERAQFEQALLDSVELEKSVHKLEATVATLAYGAMAVPMQEAKVKERLLQRIASQPRGASSDLLQLLGLPMADLKQKATELRWSLLPGQSGVEVATWQVDENFREAAFFARKTGSGRFPNHYHASGETVLVLEGDFIVDGQAYYAGEQVSAPGKTSHQPSSLTGCLLLCVSSMDDDILDT